MDEWRKDMSGETPNVDSFKSKLRLLRVSQKALGVLAINQYIADLTSLLRSNGFFTTHEIGFGLQVNADIAGTIGGQAGISTNGSTINGNIGARLLGIEFGGRITIDPNSLDPLTVSGATDIPIDIPGLGGALYCHVARAQR
jgi:hypothetical protein